MILYFAFVCISYDFKHSKIFQILFFIEIFIHTILKFFVEIFYRKFYRFVICQNRNRNIKSILQTKLTCKNLKNWRKHTFNSNLNLFERFVIFLHRNDFATSNRFYNNWTKSKIMQKFEKMLKIHNQFEFTFVWTFRNFFAFKRMLQSIIKQLCKSINQKIKNTYNAKTSNSKNFQ